MNKRKGTYYLSYSVDDTGSENYRVAYATASSPFGPFTAKGTILAKNPALGILATGHSSIIQVPGTDDWYIAYHRFAIPGGNGFHRETTIDRLYFDATGAIVPVIPTLEGIDPLVYTGVLPTAAISNAGTEGWYRAGATLTLSGGANNAKVQYVVGDGAWTTYTEPVTLSAGSYEVRYRAQGDNLIYSPAGSLAVKVDPEAPTSAVDVKTSNAASTVTLSAKDAASGVASISYRLDSAAWQVYSSPFTVTGSHRVEFFATDKAGNVEATQKATAPTGADLTGPTVTETTDPLSPTGQNGWFTDAVNLVIAASDPSGVASREYRIDGGPWRGYVKVTALPVGAITVDCRATDSVGNVSAVQTIKVKSDPYKPTVDAVTDDPTATVTLTGNDKHSGVDRILYQVDDGDWLTYEKPVVVTGVGKHKVWYRAFDLAGNESATSSVKVRIS
jgi:hypothetical protein